jgi:hypothetical protein
MCHQETRHNNNLLYFNSFWMNMWHMWLQMSSAKEWKQVLQLLRCQNHWIQATTAAPWHILGRKLTLEQIIDEKLVSSWENSACPDYLMHTWHLAHGHLELLCARDSRKDVLFVNYHPSRGHYCPAEAEYVSMLACGLVSASKGIQKWSLLW